MKKNKKNNPNITFDTTMYAAGDSLAIFLQIMTSVGLK